MVAGIDYDFSSVDAAYSLQGSVIRARLRTGVSVCAWWSRVGRAMIREGQVQLEARREQLLREADMERMAALLRPRRDPWRLRLALALRRIAVRLDADDGPHDIKATRVSEFLLT